MHHAGNSNRGGRVWFPAVFFRKIGLQFGVGRLHPGDRVRQLIRPDAAWQQRILPFMGAGGENLAATVGKNRLDARGTEFNAQNRVFHDLSPFFSRLFRKGFEIAKRMQPPGPQVKKNMSPRTVDLKRGW